MAFIKDTLIEEYERLNRIKQSLINKIELLTGDDVNKKIKLNDDIVEIDKDLQFIDIALKANEEFDRGLELEDEIIWEGKEIEELVSNKLEKAKQIAKDRNSYSDDYKPLSNESDINIVFARLDRTKQKLKEQGLLLGSDKRQSLWDMIKGLFKK